MFSNIDTWALVLAAGQGSRLATLTTVPSGVTVPKQFCSLHDGPSLLDEALSRAEAVTSSRHICSIVAAQHRCWWATALSALLAENVIVQPHNRGTAHGLLLPLLSILERDPNAQLVILPSDHHVCDEDILSQSLRRAVEQLSWRHDEILLLGMIPEEADPQLGYIVPSASDGRGAFTVHHFTEKPSSEQAQALIARGALWNAFTVVCTGQALLALFKRRIPDVVQAMRSALRQDRNTNGAARAVAALYERLPDRDFSRDVLQGQESQLRVLPVPSCGWSDLGTPERVAEALGRASWHEAGRLSSAAAGEAFLSLAAQHARSKTCRATHP
jgi:mannose-1-phosphate guanylyltransferase